MGNAGPINTITKPDLPIPERLRRNGRPKPESGRTRVRLGSELIPSLVQSSPFETGRKMSAGRTRPVRLSPGTGVTLSLIRAGTGEAGSSRGIRSVAPRRAGSGGKK